VRAGPTSQRAIYVALLAVTIVLGLASRRFAAVLPWFVGAYAGDALWAVAAYWALALARPKTALTRRALLALGISFAVEVSQLFHPAWLEAVRHVKLGGWLLGFGFVWSDLVCYAAGVTLALLIDQRLIPRSVVK
jgi:uncharacterized protein DUF2809